MSIDDLRKEIDGIDGQIVKLIADRIRLAEIIGREKREQGKQIVDIGREIKVLERIKEIARQKKIDPDDMERIYRLIMTATKGRQGIFVAFQGEPGAFSEQAALQFFGSSITTLPCETLEVVFSKVEHGEIQYGIVPVENSLEGSISQSYDLLLNSNLKVCGESELRVSHCLISNHGATLESLKQVYSHPQAFGQCRNFLNRFKFELIPTGNTAGGVKMISEIGTDNVGAIASERAADFFGMKILVRGIEDNSNNFTRFFLLCRQDIPATGNDKTSIVFSVPHKPGSLFNFLNILAENQINMTKIESRPTRQKPWEYNFYLDFEGHREDVIVKKVLKQMEENTIFLKVLGSYPRANR
jgi:chorismate mutase / prephenate dehydratase